MLKVDNDTASQTGPSYSLEEEGSRHRTSDETNRSTDANSEAACICNKEGLEWYEMCLRESVKGGVEAHSAGLVGHETGLGFFFFLTE